MKDKEKNQKKQLIRNFVKKIGINIGGRKNSNGDDISTKGDVNIDKSINIHISNEKAKLK